MRDAGVLRDRIRDMLTTEVPRKITLLRPEWHLDAAELPDVGMITSGEPPEHALTSVGDVPSADGSTVGTWITVLNPRLFHAEQVDIDPAGRPVYMCRYSSRIYVWAKAGDWDRAKDIRDRLAVVVRMALLEWPNLTPDHYGDTGYRLHRNTYTEQFGEPTRLTGRAGGRVWAPALLSVDIDVEETLADGSTRTPIGAAETLAPTAHAVGPTGPLPDTA